MRLNCRVVLLLLITNNSIVIFVIFRGLIIIEQTLPNLSSFPILLTRLLQKRNTVVYIRQQLCREMSLVVVRALSSPEIISGHAPAIDQSIYHWPRKATLKPSTTHQRSQSRTQCDADGWATDRQHTLLLSHRCYLYTSYIFASDFR